MNGELQGQWFSSSNSILATYKQDAQMAPISLNWVFFHNPSKSSNVHGVNLQIFIQSPRVLETSLVILYDILWGLQPTGRGINSISRAGMLGRHIILLSAIHKTIVNLIY